MKKSAVKGIFSAFLIFALSLSLFTGCDNFMKAQGARNDIMSAIDYNNAPSYIIYLQTTKGSGAIKIVQGDQISKKVTDTFNIRFEPEDDHVFIKWEAEIPEIKDGESPSDYIYFDDEKSLETKITFKKAAKGIVIRPVCPERLSVTKFNLNDESQIYSRDSSIVITFNKEIPDECKDKVSISIPGLPEGKTSADYFLPGEISGKEITIRTKYSQTRLEEDLIPVKGSVPIHVTFPAKSIFYVNKDYLEPISIYNDKDISYTYTINSETSKKTQIKFHIDEQFVDYSTMRVNDDLYSEHPEKYSVGTTLNLSYKISDDYQFYGWKLTRSNPDSEEDVPVEYLLPDNADTLSEINLSVTYKEENLSQPIFIINNYLDGLITIEPNVSKIPEVSINIDGEHGTFTPGKGTEEYKLGVLNHIEFDSVSDYAFLRWQVINTNDNTEILLNDSWNGGLNNSNAFIGFTDPTKAKTDFIVLQEPGEDENMNFAIKPVVAERPRVISTSPTYNPKGVLRDTTIQIMFDNNMSEDSIYFKVGEPEYDAIEKQENVTAFLYTDSTQTKCYGYVKDGQTYFKNISITNSRNDTNLNDKFKMPVFENARTLSIPVSNKDALTEGLRISVQINDGFFYRKDGVDVSLSRSEKWQYLVNNEIDTTGPTSSSLTVKAAGNQTLDPDTDCFSIDDDIADWMYFGNNKFNLSLMVSDDAAVDSTFNIVYKKLYDYSNSTYTRITSPVEKKIGIEYTGAYGNNASFDGDCELTGLEDGIYSIHFELKDASGNTSQYPYEGDGEQRVYKDYFFCLDNTAPVIAAPEEQSGVADIGEIKLKWTVPSSLKDYKETVIAYREWGTTGNYVETDTIEKGTYTTTLTNLKKGTHYEIVAKYTDYAGNTNSVPLYDGAYTRPDVPKEVVVDNSQFGTTATLTCTKPEHGESTSFRISHRFVGGNWTPASIYAIDDVDTDIDIVNLAHGKEYEFEVRSYDTHSQKYSEPYYISSTTYPTFKTQPNKVSNWTQNFNSNTDSGTINITKPADNVSGYFIYCSTEASFPEDPDKTKVKQLDYTGTTIPGASTQDFTDLTPGTCYYIKVLSYYDSEENLSEPSIIAKYTKCAPVNASSIECTAESNSAINVAWEAPQGGHYSYTVSYKVNSTSSWLGSQNVNGNNTDTIIEGLNGGTKYDFKIVVNGNPNSDAQISSTAATSSACWTCPDPAKNFYAEKLSDNSFKITWAAPEGSYSGYKLYYSKDLNNLDSGTTKTYEAGTTTDTITGLDTKALYYLKLETYMNEPELHTYTAPIGCSLALDGVRNIKATPLSTSSVKIDWTNPDITFNGIKVYRGSTLLTSTALSSSTTTYTVTGLPANQKDTYTVELFKDENGTTLSAKTPVTACSHAVPITTFTAAATNPTNVELTWTKPSSGWTKLYIYKNNEYLDWWGAGDPNSDSYDASAGSTDTYKIVTLNQLGEINNDQPATTTITMPPSTVTNIRCTATTKTSATISWTNPSSTFTGIKIYKKLSSATSFETKPSYTITNKATTSKEITGLSAGNSYDFMIESYISNVTNIGESSSKTITGCCTKPNSTTLSSSSATATTITYKWSKPSGSITGYVLYYKKSSASGYSSVTLSSSALSTTIPGLSKNTIYDAYIAPYYSTTSNSTSSSVFKKATAPDVPTGLSVSNYNGGTRVSWTAPETGADSYVVYYRKGSNTWSSKTTTDTYYNFGNTDLTTYTQYEFKVQACSTLNSETQYSSDTSSKTFYTPPASINVSAKIYSDDGMGNVIVEWFYPSGRGDVAGINIYLDDKYKTYYNSAYAGTYIYTTFNLPSYKRNKSYYFYFEPYHFLNSETRGPKDSKYYYNSAGNLAVNGKSVEKSGLINILTETKKIENHPQYGAFYSGRNVTLTQYSLGKYEVTEELWDAVMGNTSTDSKYPKTWINWMQAIAFCNKLSALQGLEPCYEIVGYSYNWKTFNMNNVPKATDSAYAAWYGCKQNLKKNGYHLPTQAQWEFAARGANPGDGYWLMGIAGSTNSNYNANYCVSNKNSSSAQVVGSKYSNSIGLHDMSGNVWEFLTDWKHTFYAKDYTDPYCEVRSHSDGELVNGCSALAYDPSKIVVYKTGGSYGDDYSVCTVYYLDERFYAPDADPWSGLRLCRNVTY